MALYPLKFKAQLFHKIWGGQTIAQWYQHVPADYENVGEAWVLSDVEKYPTEVENGSHAGDRLQDMLEVYMDELVGEKVYDIYGNHFPLLLKFIDAVDDLSIQVHPDDEYALNNEQSLGKTEMWYVLPAAKESAIFLGWNKHMDAASIHQAISDGSLVQCLHEYAVEGGDIAYIPAGTVHAMKRNTIVAEIQENSDITYRLYDYNRVGNDGCMRPLKLEKALEVLNYEASENTAVTHPKSNEQGIASLCQTPYFSANRLQVKQTIQRDYASLDSFVAFMCVSGEAIIEAMDTNSPDKQVTIKQGEAILIPAVLNDILIKPTTTECHLLEIYIE